MGVVCVTYGAGGHNMVNPIAGAFSEKLPILVISGGPGEDERKLGVLIHHQAKEVESQYHIYKEVTCAAKIISNNNRAASDIDEVIQTMMQERRPGYLEIHRDMVDLEISVPDQIRGWDGHFQRTVSDAGKVVEAARDVAARLQQAKRPVLIVGIEVNRFGLMNEVVRLAEGLGIPVLTNLLAKGAFPMDHPLSMGVHMGSLSHSAIHNLVEQADLVLSLGTLLTDVDLGNQPPSIPREKSIWAVEHRVHVSFHTYTNVHIADFVQALLKAKLPCFEEKVTYYDNLPEPSKGTESDPIGMAVVIAEINQFLHGRNDFLIVAESGDSVFAGLDIKVCGGGIYMAQGYYSSMGFAVPAALGAQIGTGVRPLVLCGDGAFQMTGQEIAQAPRYGLNPIILLFNNQGWGLFRPIVTDPTLLSIPNWPCAELARLWGGVGLQAKTAIELREALAIADKAASFVIIEIAIQPNDLSPVATKYIELAGKKANMEGK
jgi:indolepyruvate decarboxylase